MPEQTRIFINHIAAGQHEAVRQNGVSVPEILKQGCWLTKVAPG